MKHKRKLDMLSVRIADVHGGHKHKVQKLEPNVSGVMLSNIINDRLKLCSIKHLIMHQHGSKKYFYLLFL